MVRMKTLRIELLAVDARRWAFLHIPLGVVLGIYFTAWFVRQEHPGSMETPFAILLGIPFVVALVCFAAWLQVALINAFIGIMRGGPVIYAKEVEVEAHKINPIG
ncbi:MAG: hypothetical protein O3B13_17390 [Planctomycetota bacterium]|nr:hypothetical protein [Planctomycetota bacterium]